MYYARENAPLSAQMCVEVMGDYKIGSGGSKMDMGGYKIINLNLTPTDDVRSRLNFEDELDKTSVFTMTGVIDIY